MEAEDQPQNTKPESNALALPSAEVLREIARKQEERAKEIRERRKKAGEDVGAGDERSKAAAIIQRNYRGHRERRALEGYGLSPSTRWLEV